MKKIYILCFILLFFGEISAQNINKDSTQQQTNQPKRSIVKTNIISFFIGGFHVAYERKLAKHVGGQIMLTYFNHYTNWRDDIYGFAVTPEIKFYLEKEAPNGIYLSFSPRYKHLILKEEVSNNNPNIVGTITTQTSNLDMVGSGLLFGVQRVMKNNLAVDFFLGTSYNINVGAKNIAYSNTGELRSLLGFRIGFHLGYAF